MPYNFGDVVLVRYPFTNQTGWKQRPAVVVSSRAYNTSTPDIVVMAITSKVHTILNFGEVQLTQWQAAGLLKPSAIKPVFTTMEQALVRKTLGSLGTFDQSAVRQAIPVILMD